MSDHSERDVKIDDMAASSSSSSSEPHYTLSPHPPHTDSSFHPLPTDPTPPPQPMSLREAPGPDIFPDHRPTLAEFRASEGPAARASKLRALWKSLPALPSIPDDDEPTPTKMMQLPGQGTTAALSLERAERLKKLYEEELVKRISEERPDSSLWGGPDDLEPEMKNLKGKGIAWQDFRRFLWDKERELWDIFQELDHNADGRLDAQEMRAALARSGVDVTPATVSDLVHFLASHSSKEGLPKVPSQGGSEEGLYLTFADFRDFLIMLPRKATPFEIYKFYQVRKRFSDGRGAARVDKEGDISVSFPKAPNSPQTSTAAGFFHPPKQHKEEDDEFADTPGPYDEDVEVVQEDRHEAWRFLLAGGIAGGVSRTVTAPFDRLKVYLITTDDFSAFNRHPHFNHPLQNSFRAVTNLWGAVQRIYVDGGGLRAFWVGNGLNVTKIFPESAIKFVSYEQSKKFLAKYWDKVSDPSELSSSSRFISGGVGGITSQLAIYGLETLKTRIQSDIGPNQGWKHVVKTAKEMWRAGGVRTYYRGLTLGLVGVFPYSAIDMGTYETLKTAYCRSTKTDEPPVFAVLSFGALSGSIGAASVYPVNLLRTRLQASGSSGHPHQYTGFRDVMQQTLKNEGWRGLYKGLLPSILKVGPAVGVSWIVYEESKRMLGV
ncbi:solute carrier family 25 (mitochondrial phosphate transporter), member 23/24/25/41 [Cryptococcus neoformans]|uniref:Solute carrier family 25 (Mitochondrial phosphate transporter), member 23/24/25/41 n=2 Tax=Cryptococcus neoformans TaxID=5207 RepID=A0A854Q5V5_CRYNE|nr:solute carrier family 25 (mitochondrial phosphate transporter), member 23/24/25/41 [Cryptococcus neoformans var. grubii H99]AUB27740.1 solute carrier family 25 (mitochondrial phosphate transporter), member 23/24/25/41 [Cryptococcus neoformans var. grubii]OWT39508.1 solute carrier family 25 (mitochondrial phosphate transporter), member 23/24/25/41 [Cryptococcus neoformans var. grubii Bt1]OWZ27451.1 solute carrier family 25 (mitochondrial phosphate transporter), member 23/24/25/41 [Cryptococcus|eukprot:XP_012052338.1 solute carrier family 25 (mitochondrial phosphate transporter), member 23/24/25/41 [Cryptococcus neoformans var. grubii H99]